MMETLTDKLDRDTLLALRTLTNFMAANRIIDVRIGDNGVTRFERIDGTVSVFTRHMLNLLYAED